VGNSIYLHRLFFRDVAYASYDVPWLIEDTDLPHSGWTEALVIPGRPPWVSEFKEDTWKEKPREKRRDL
jgi:hypothetical protein